MLAKVGLRGLYLYAVCLVTLVMLLVGAVGTVSSAAHLLYPGPEYYDPYMYTTPEGESLSGEELEGAQERSREVERRRSILDLAGWLALLAVAGPVYLYHWRQVQRDHRSEELSEPLVAPDRPVRDPSGEG